jgi:hypothetical protein
MSERDLLEWDCDAAPAPIPPPRCRKGPDQRGGIATSSCQVAVVPTSVVERRASKSPSPRGSCCRAFGGRWTAAGWFDLAGRRGAGSPLGSAANRGHQFLHATATMLVDRFTHHAGRDRGLQGHPSARFFTARRHRGHGPATATSSQRGREAECGQEPASTYPGRRLPPT